MSKLVIKCDDQSKMIKEFLIGDNSIPLQRLMSFTIESSAPTKYEVTLKYRAIGIELENLDIENLNVIKEDNK